MEAQKDRLPRVHLLDEVRGLCILLMVLYHGAYDLVYLFGVNIPVFHWPVLDAAQSFFAGVFIFIAGIASRYSHSNLRRGLVALGLGVGISLVTWALMPGQMIWFGILHFMGVAMMLFALLRPLLDRLPVPVGLSVSLLLFLATMDVSRGRLGIRFLPGISIPREWYRLRWLLPIGIGGGGADYFPLLPWLFVFLAGSYAGFRFVQGRMPQSWYRPHLPWLAAVGRRTILIYVLHQPVVYGILWVVFRLIGR